MNLELINKIKSARHNIIICGAAPFASDHKIWNELTAEAFCNYDGIKITIIAESDNQLFDFSMRSDSSYAEPANRVSFSALKFRRELFEGESKKHNSEKNNWEFLTSTIFISNYLIKIDDELWYLPFSDSNSTLHSYKQLDSHTPLYRQYSQYLNGMIDKEKDGRFLAKKGQELLELFDQDRIPRGIFPRSCFYDTDHYQFVVWCFVFNRAGEVLIHQRSITAKDNRGAWDKSVGGHVDFSLERSSNHTSVRELIEELFTDEAVDGSGSLLEPMVDKPLFLGDWRPESVGPDYLSHIGVLERDSPEGLEPWVYYKVPGSTEHNSPRLLPDKTERKLRVIADTYIFITDTSVTPKSLKGDDSKFKNSRFELVKLEQLKSWIDGGAMPNGESFEVTPDLSYVMTGKMRNILEEVSQLVQYSNIRKLKPY